MDFKGKKVAISGGNSGIGKAAALQFARAGAHVAVLARDQARLDAVVAECKAINPSGVYLAVSVDLTDDAAADAAAQTILAGLGGLDVLIANQGYARASAVSDQSTDAFRSLMDTNFFGHVRLVRAFLPHFKAQKSGVVSLVTSMLGFMSFYGYGAYSASKFAIVGFGEALRQELLPYNVAVNIFYPPTTDTPGLVTENETKPALSWKIEGSSRKFTPDEVAKSLMQGISRGAFTHMIGIDSWAIFYLSRWFPGIVRRVLDQALWAYVKENGPNV